MFMKKIVKALALGAMLIAVVILPFTACSNTPVAAGFALPHYNGMSDDGLYDAGNFYLNELRTVGADPGAIYCSVEDITDSFNKSKATALAMNPSLTEEKWEEENGDLNYWIDEYANAFYMIVTSFTGSVSNEVKSEYESVQGAYKLYKSYDLTDWDIAGRIDGYAINVRSDAWSNGTYWAPEFIRDPVSGRYFIFASAQSKNGNASTEYFPGTGTYYNMLYGIIAMSDNPIGPYELVSNEEYYATIAAYDENGEMVVNENNEVIGLDGSVITTVNDNGNILNKNGNIVTRNTPPMNFGLYVDQIKELYPFSDLSPGQTHQTAVWPCIDFNPVIMDNGDMYVYFSQHVSDINAGNHIWGIKMKDMITPDYSTLTFLASPNYSIEKYTPEEVASLSESQIKQDFFAFGNGEKTTYEFGGYYYKKIPTEMSEGSINEGTEVIQHGDKYYLTYSPYGYGNRAYAVRQAVGDSPLGPFTKLGAQYNPVMGINATNDYMAGTGHHCFIKAGDELFILYHAFYNPIENSPNGGFLGRAIGADRAQFMYNEELGYDILYGNGPTYSFQPLPDVASGMTNVAKNAKIKVSGDENTAKYLNDGLFTVQDFTFPWEYVDANEDQKGTTITLTWDTPVEIKSFIIYNSQNYFYAFDKVDLVRFKLAEKPAWYNLKDYNDYCYIENLECNPENVEENDFFMRQGGGALASFDNIKVTEMTIYINSKYTTEAEELDGSLNYAIHVSDIFVMGKEVK